MADARERHIEAAMVACPRCAEPAGRPCVERYCRNGRKHCDYVICSAWRETAEPHIERSVKARQEAPRG